MRAWTVWQYLAVVVSVLMCLAVWAGSAVYGADPNSPPGVTGWALLGANPVFGQSEELRVGYDLGGSGALSWLEPAAGVLHSDRLDNRVAAWAARGYLIAHAIDAAMISPLIGGAQLPAGNLYGGLWGQYEFSQHSISGGWLVGGIIEWPSQIWQTVAEYDHDLWGERADTQTVVIGLRRKF
jgi:hypothetical protein